MLDLESVRLFVLAVDLGNLTRAAEAAGTVQPVVSQRVKALEAMLGRRLLDRTPRFVRPTEEGKAFLTKARSLLAAHDEALRFTGAPAVRFSFGASDHALGLGLERLLIKVRAALPADAVIDVQSGMSQAIHERFNAGALDAAIIRRDGGGVEGEILGRDPLGWRAREGWTLPPHGPVPLAMLLMPAAVLPSPLAVLLLPKAELLMPLAVLPPPKAEPAAPLAVLPMPKAEVLIAVAELSTPTAVLFWPVALLERPKAAL